MSSGTMTTKSSYDTSSSSYNASLVASITTRTVMYTLASMVMVHVVWQNYTPHWIKKHLKWNYGNNNNDGGKDKGDSMEDVTNPVTVWNKIQQVFEQSRTVLVETVPLFDTMQPFQLYCCFMSMIHLMNELDIHEPTFREWYFSSSGSGIEEEEDVAEEDLEVLSHNLDLAHWAYKRNALELQSLLKSMGYQLIRHDLVTEPGRVGHYVAVNYETSRVVISIKGTSTLSDVLTDVIGNAVPHFDTTPWDTTTTTGTSIQYHEGMYLAAKMMLEDTHHLIEKFFLPQKFQIVICGHSLGAGVACVLGMLLKQSLKDVANTHNNPSQTNKNTHWLQVYAFATPACCSLDASISCQEYVTSVINNNDCVPRLSVSNLVMMSRLFVLIDSKLKEKGLQPNNWKSAKRYIQDLMTIDSHFILSSRELKKFFSIQQEERKQKERSMALHDHTTDTNTSTNTSMDKGGLLSIPLNYHHLYVPGRVISIWNHTSDPTILGGKVTTGQSPALRQILVETNMISNHSCDSYRQNILHLLEQTANTI